MLRSRVLGGLWVGVREEMSSIRGDRYEVLRIGNLFKCLIRFQCKFNELPTKTEEVNVDGAEE